MELKESKITVVRSSCHATSKASYKQKRVRHCNSSRLINAGHTESPQLKSNKIGVWCTISVLDILFQQVLLAVGLWNLEDNLPTLSSRKGQSMAGVSIVLIPSLFEILSFQKSVAAWIVYARSVDFLRFGLPTEQSI